MIILMQIVEAACREEVLTERSSFPLFCSQLTWKQNVSSFEVYHPDAPSICCCCGSSLTLQPIVASPVKLFDTLGDYKLEWCMTEWLCGWVGVEVTFPTRQSDAVETAGGAGGGGPPFGVCSKFSPVRGHFSQVLPSVVFGHGWMGLRSSKVNVHFQNHLHHFCSIINDTFLPFFRNFLYTHSAITLSRGLS